MPKQKKKKMRIHENEKLVAETHRHIVGKPFRLLLFRNAADGLQQSRNEKN